MKTRTRTTRLVALALMPLALLACQSKKSEGKPDNPIANGAFAPSHGQPSSLIAKIVVGGQPCGLETIGNILWVTDAESAKLIKIDTDTQKIVGRFPLDAKPCELMASRKTLWVVTQSGVLDRVDPSSGKVLKKIPIGQGAYEALDAFGSIWVTNRNSRTVTQINPATDKVTYTLRLPAIQPGGITATSHALWIGDDTSGRRAIVRYDPIHKTNTLINSGGRPNFVTTGGGYVWVANRDDGTVSQIDPNTGALRATILAGLNPVNLDGFDAGSPEVWVPDDVGSLLTRIDATTGTAIERIAVGKGPAVALVSSTVVWVSNFEDGSVWGFLPGPR